MSHKQWLILVLVTTIVTLTESSTTPSPANSIQQNDGTKKPLHDDKLPMALNPKFNKMLPEPIVPQLSSSPSKVNNIDINTITTIEKKATSKIPLAEDPRFNKMLPEKSNNKKKDDGKDKIKKDKDYNEDDNYYDDDYYDNYDDETSNETQNKTQTPLDIVTDKVIEIKKNEIKHTEGVNKIKPKVDIKKNVSNNKNNNNNGNDEEDDDDDDDIEDEEDIVYNENVPCPRDCICARNVNSYLVATCSRLDPDVQKFGSDITDLVVVDVGPKYPILLGPEFFLNIGLKHVSSIKISNCSIEYIHPTAFHGLDELFSVNLTNVGLTTIHPDTFEKNTRLRLLTISDNDLSQTLEKDSPNLKYFLKSASLEEIDLSDNNLNKLPATAFNELKNIIYINLAQNNLKTLPEKIFDQVETIEELDLSYNSISTLPQHIFNKTSLAILHLKYNDITGDLKFGTSDLQQLDLSFCSIKHVTNFMFNKMEGLTNLNLKGNGLIKVQPEAFSTLKNLRSIDLSMNDLEQVSSLLFYKNSELDVIKLNDNPRLSQLPTDGFQSMTGGFNVYYFDISNCAIGALGFNTFSTMRQLTTLKLAWNNINNLDKLIFTTLDRLTELDLSNNLIVKLDDLTFIHNRELTKLNLAGNPIKKLSAKLFLPFTTLKELDVSECELHSLLSDNYFGVDSRFKFYETLRSFNASFNQIKKISKEDVQYFKNLKTLDISNNPLKCNEEFRNLMKWLSKKDIISRKLPTNANIQDTIDTSVSTVLTSGQSISMQSAQTWDELTRAICKRAIDNFKPNEDVIDKKLIIKDDKVIVNKVKENANNNKNINKEDIEEDTSIGEENDESDEQEDENDSEYNEDDYDEESDDDNGDQDNDENDPLIKDKGLFADEVDLIRETQDKFLRRKLGNEIDDDELNVDRIYYTSYKFLLPLLIILCCIITLLLIVGKILTMMMKKRGERYRQAILASKNSIVYQKLSEEIITPPTPKVHRYAPINQV